MIARLPEVLSHFFLKQWHEVASEDQISRVIAMVQEKIDLRSMEGITTTSKFPPPLKIRGLRGRTGKEESTESY